MNRLLLPVLGVTLALGSCNSRETVRTPQLSASAPRYASLDAILDAGTGTAASLQTSPTSTAQLATPVAALPAWIGRPMRLREHEDADTFEQVISLSLKQRGQAHENLVMVTVPRSRAALERLVDGSTRFKGKPTEAGIRSELAAMFPGITMQVVTRPASNTYGPYGLAIGRNAGGARCLYAWQWIEEAPAVESGQTALTPLSLRVRLCRDDITAEAMAASVNQLRLQARFEGAPVDAPVSMAAQPSAEAPRRARHEGRDAHRTGIERAPRPMRAPSPSIASRAPPDLSGRRYLGADPSPASGPAPSQPAASAPVAARAIHGALAGLGGPTPASRSVPIRADLPPEAYRGPATKSSRGQP